MVPVASERAREAAEEHLTNHLHKTAHEAGWPHEAYRGLHVQHTDDGFQIGIHNSVQDKVMDLEYGTQSSAPSGLLRQFHNRMYEHSDQAVMTSLMKSAAGIL
jgi:hypothetical protein